MPRNSRLVISVTIAIFLAIFVLVFVLLELNPSFSGPVNLIGIGLIVLGIVIAVTGTVFYLRRRSR